MRIVTFKEPGASDKARGFMVSLKTMFFDVAARKRRTEV